MNKNVIIAILIVIIIAVVGFTVFSQQAPTLTTASDKINTEFDLLTDNTLANGDQIKFQLKEVNGSAIAGEKVKIGFTDGTGKIETFEVVTDSNGKAALVLENEDSGDHVLTLAYGGNDKYNGCAITLNITVEDDSDSDDSSDVSDDNSVSSDNPSSSNSDLPDNPEHWHYDAETGQYYNDDGIIVGDSQWAGDTLEHFKKLWREGNGDPFANMT